ncbi:MAG: glycine zipper domain-containing protein [Pseudomonadota bacterium]
MNKIIPFVVVLLANLVTPIQAKDINGGAVIGGALGGATGAGVGSAIGGREGAIIGGGLGGALGAAIGSSENAHQEKKVVHIHEVNHYQKRHDNGRHLGHSKQKHKHKHKHK